MRILILFLVIPFLFEPSKCAKRWFNKKCQKIIDGCKIHNYYTSVFFRINMLVCRDLSSSRAFTEENIFKYHNCTVGKTMLLFRPDSPRMLDGSFDLEKSMQISKALCGSYQFGLVNLKGFALDLPEQKVKNIYMEQVGVIFFWSKFTFYSDRGKKVIKSCESLLKLKQINSILNLISPQNQLAILNLKNVKFTHPICPFVFNFTVIGELLVEKQMKTFYGSNFLSFENLKTNNSFNVIIKLKFENFLNLDLDHTSLDSTVFRSTNVMKFGRGDLNSIESGLFKSFPNLTRLDFDAFYWLRFVHKQGLAWLHDLNSFSDPIDLSNPISPDQLVRYFVLVVDNMHENGVEKGDYPYYKLFVDADFCLYKDFPFEKLVILVLKLNPVTIEETFTWPPSNSTSCTFLFLIQYFEEYAPNGSYVQDLLTSFDVYKEVLRNLNGKKYIFLKVFKISSIN